MIELVFFMTSIRGAGGTCVIPMLSTFCEAYETFKFKGFVLKASCMKYHNMASNECTGPCSGTWFDAQIVIHCNDGYVEQGLVLSYVMSDCVIKVR